MLMVELPQVAENKARLVGAEDWIIGLESLLADLRARWSIAIGRVDQDTTEPISMSSALIQSFPPSFRNQP